MSYAPVITSRVTTRSALATVALVVAGAGLTALLAQWYVPMWPVPISGQTLGVLLVGATLGWKAGGVSILLYLALGAADLPVFTEGGAGIEVLFGPTTGYLLAFPVAAALVGRMAEARHDRRFVTMVGAFLAGSAVIYVGGVIGLMITLDYSLAEAIREGVVKFLIGDTIKAIMAGVLVPGAWKLIGDKS